MEQTVNYPFLVLAGQNYPVKPLVVRQLRVVVPALMRLRNARIAALTQEQFDDLAEIAYIAISPLQPGLTKEAFGELPIKAIELMSIIPVIAKQSGMTSEAESSGEAPAGNQTGT